MIKDLLSKRLVFVESEKTMFEVVQVMRDHNISSVLVLNRERLVVGIVTERDIVQKFTLLEKEQKLDAQVGAFMTRPVLFARLHHLEDDVRFMFFDKRIRHFPVADGSLHERNILGMLTVTDLTGAYLRKSTKAHVDRQPLVIVASDPLSRGRYIKLFESLKYIPIAGDQTSRLLQQAIEHSYPVIYDLDMIPLETAKSELRQLKDYRGTFIILSSSEKLVEALKKTLDSEQHFVALKPLDISYILRLIEPSS